MSEPKTDVLGDIATQMVNATAPVPYTPPAPSQPEAPAEAATPEPAPEPTSEQGKKWLGKYSSEQEAERGYHESVRMGNEAKARADAAEAELQRLRQAVNPQPAPEADPMADIETYGLPKDVFEKAVRAAARAELQAAFAPAVEKTKADQAIIEKYPEYQEKFNDIRGFLDTQPEILSQVAELESKGQFLAARQIAYLNWKVASAASAEAEMASRAEDRRRETEKARVDANTGSPRKAESRSPSTPQAAADDRRVLLERARMGYPQQYLQNVLDPWIPDTFRKELDQLGS